MGLSPVAELFCVCNRGIHCDVPAGLGDARQVWEQSTRLQGITRRHQPESNNFVAQNARYAVHSDYHRSSIPNRTNDLVAREKYCVAEKVLSLSSVGHNAPTPGDQNGFQNVAMQSSDQAVVKAQRFQVTIRGTVSELDNDLIRKDGNLDAALAEN